MASFFEQSPVAGATFDDAFYTSIKGALVELEAELMRYGEGGTAADGSGVLPTAQRVAELLGTRSCTATEEA